MTSQDITRGAVDTEDHITEHNKLHQLKVKLKHSFERERGRETAFGIPLSFTYRSSSFSMVCPTLSRSYGALPGLGAAQIHHQLLEKDIF